MANVNADADAVAAVDAKFPLLCLSQVAFEHLYTLLDTEDIILLAEVAPIYKEDIARQERVKRGQSLQVEVNKTKTSVTLVNDGKRVFRWTFVLRRHNIVADSIEFFERNIGGAAYQVALRPAESSTDWLSVNDYLQFETDIQHVVTCFLDIFKCPISKLTLDFYDHTDFERLLVKSPVFHQAECIEVADCAFEKEEITFMLDHFKTDKLVFLGTAGKYYKYEKPVLAFPKIQMKIAAWLGDEDLLQMAGSLKQIALENSPLITDEALNKMIKHWLEGGYKQLEFVRFALPQPRNGGQIEGHFDVQKILADITTTTGVEKRNDLVKNFLHTGNDYQNGVDIRHSDGRLATVHLKRDQICTSFNFAIWSEANPNVARQ